MNENGELAKHRDNIYTLKELAGSKGISRLEKVALGYEQMLAEVARLRQLVKQKDKIKVDNPARGIHPGDFDRMKYERDKLKSENARLEAVNKYQKDKLDAADKALETMQSIMSSSFNIPL